MLKSRKKARDMCIYIYVYIHVHTHTHIYTSVEEVESVSQISGKEGHHLVMGRLEKAFEL